MDYTPNQVIRMVQLGMKDELLKSNTIWICASCSTCSTRCPCNVEVAHVMESLRIMAGRSGTAPAGKAKYVEIMYNALLSTVEKYGRTYEVGLVLQNNLRSGKLFNGADMGMPMLQKGKLKPSPSKVKARLKLPGSFRSPENGRWCEMRYATFQDAVLRHRQGYGLQPRQLPKTGYNRLKYPTGVAAAQPRHMVKAIY